MKRKRREVDRRETVGSSLETLGNSSGRAPLGRSVYGSDDWVDGGETVGNSMGGAPYGSCDAETTRGNPGKSLGRAPVGRSDTGVTTGRTEGKPWEIARGELRWEGAIRKR